MNPKISLPERLRGLPDFEPPAGGWSRLVNQMERAPARRQRRALAPLALAASVLAAVGTGWLMPAAPTATIDPSTQQVARLMQQSQDLEQRLRSVRPQVVVWNGALADRAANLRNDLAVVDLQLGYARHAANPAGVERLWQNRVSLMSRLVQTHEDATLSAVAVNQPQEHML